MYDGQEIGIVPLNIKGLNLLNMSYKKNDTYIHYKKYKSFVVRGELNKLPKCDGTIIFLENGSVYEVALKKEIANNKLKPYSLDYI